MKRDNTRIAQHKNSGNEKTNKLVVRRNSRLHFYSKNLHDVTEAGDDKGGRCGLFVLRVAVEEEGIEA